jgi:hypothetical protein
MNRKKRRKGSFQARVKVEKHEEEDKGHSF